MAAWKTEIRDIDKMRNDLRARTRDQKLQARASKPARQHGQENKEGGPGTAVEQQVGRHEQRYKRKNGHSAKGSNIIDRMRQPGRTDRSGQVAWTSEGEQDGLVDLKCLAFQDLARKPFEQE